MDSNVYLQVSWIQPQASKNQFNIKLSTKEKLKKKLVSTLELLSVTGSYIVEIELVSKAKIQVLNKEYRNKNQGTDVLSFPTYIQFSDSKNTQVLGTIFVCLDYIFEKKNKSFVLDSKNLQDLVTHGFIHTLGFDHEKDPDAWNNLEKNIKLNNKHV